MKEFKAFRPNDKWQKFQSDWFYKGLKSHNITPKDGVDVKKALRHLAAIHDG